MSVQATVAWLNKNSANNNNITSVAKTQTAPVRSWKKRCIPEELNMSGADTTLERTRSPLIREGAVSLFEKSASSGASTMRNTATAQKRSNTALNNRQKTPTATLTHNTDGIIHDLIHMYQDSLDQYQAAQDTVQQMQQVNEREQQHSIGNKSSESDRALIRDYEIRIRYLSEKVERLSAESDDLERQLALYRGSHGNAHTAMITHAIHTPMAPVLANQRSSDDKQRRATLETKSTRQSNRSEDFWNCLLDSYEKEDSVGTTITMDGDVHDDRISIDKEAISEELLFVQKQVVELEKGARLMFEQQARELHNERSQNRQLSKIIEKQNHLIHILEEKLGAVEYKKDQFLLQEQIELQQIELEDKRALLGRLLDEREEILQHHHQRINPNRSRSASVRSSIDILSEMSKTESNSKYSLSRTSSSSLQHSIHCSTHGRSTPPLTAPPRDPLPPLPYRTSLSIRESLHSATGPASGLSPATSWSSAEYAVVSRRSDLVSGAASRDIFLQQQQQQPLQSHSTIGKSACASSPLANRQSLGKLSFRKSSRSSSIQSNTTFWKGWKQRLGSRS
ncbi:hypothetical protein BX666DRAFT_2029841 [Dichotomocladium elegans]|nr:hypothetical protein BX666DRAFT_2029841 [Dichotomocladium elegans]